MFFLGLVKVQGGSSPLLPYYDNLYVDAAKAQRAAEHVFAQAPYIFRQKVNLSLLLQQPVYLADGRACTGDVLCPCERLCTCLRWSS